LAEIRFTKSARRHRIGRASARHVMATTTATPISTINGNLAWFYLGADERGRELEIVAIEVEADEHRAAALLVIHVMPTHLRKE
jgi:hypothetical protein